MNTVGIGDDSTDRTRIAQGVGGEISADVWYRSHRITGDQSRKRNAVALILLLPIDEKEALILSNGSPNGAAKLIQVELFRRGCEKALGVQWGIAQEFEQRSMESITSRLRGHQHGRAGARAILRRVVIGKDFKLLNGINRR